jgi:general secretion pathway protein G
VTGGAGGSEKAVAVDCSSNSDGGGKEKQRKDRFLHPLNTDYDLYSTGADGKTKAPLAAKDSQDDIIRANDGAYIGVAANF